MQVHVRTASINHHHGPSTHPSHMSPMTPSQFTHVSPTQTTHTVRNLLENARYGHLCTMMSNMHHRRAGYPFGTLVDFAVDGAGKPFFCLSPLAIHSRWVGQQSTWVSRAA